ncbi:MAG: DUF1828 domain-containing protein [Anaerolineaceae bacterium]|nr:DUF1828 domain-containing protein [Anaerolineaceae bacterium]
MFEINKLIAEYTSWLNSKISVEKYGEVYEMTTPFLDRFNDYLQIYVIPEKSGELTLTDGGYIIDNLLSSGVSLKQGSKKLNKIYQIIKNFGLNLNGEKITVTAKESQFAQKKHSMVQAMLAIDELYETEPRAEKDFFSDDVKTYFDNNNIYYSDGVSFEGKSGSTATYDLLFQRNRNHPERLCNIVSRMTESSRNMMIFNWLDIAPVRKHDSMLIIILNDSIQEVQQRDIDALESYNITPALFSESEKLLALCN